MRYLVAALIGGLFGLGITLSGMANPAKVLNFFDLAGSFDPSLAIVMAGALSVAAPGYALVFRKQRKPVYDTEFHLPRSNRIDARLVLGSAVFGIGWGIGGFCPGASIPALGLGHASSFIFVLALIVGILVAGRMQQSILLKRLTARFGKATENDLIVDRP
ncbi:hypothetical protein SAMN04515647_1151 [Cohaesibacter sp. ES.047]|uniref:DUF6691 family protein n=1 Tax=Cohaesibacter sp. ES.047 TaxID=1798205 RepID=UPI000BB6B7FB|nr:DUF6691 family protein [Cohaesibacter sp. ES.047]SNY90960.1 hypothetical protein SAMN04515647_1151 [Cohaesibacter sp. ES.047]